MGRMTPWCGAVAAAAVLAGCGGGDKVSSAPSAAGGGRDLEVTSTAFAPNGTIPARFTCTGAGDRPALRFGGVPAGAKELALLVIDPDAGGGGFVHWTVYGMAPRVRGIAATGLPAGAREGRNSAGRTGWTPPCPPSGIHRYMFELYWLRAPSKLAAGADPQEVVDAIKAAAAGRGELIGRFGRGG
jgi:Raf kinase inhibitor-like YbhB/YbcL family protein